MVFQHSRVLPGNLNVSRTLGDIETKVKKYGGLPGTIIPDPDIFLELPTENCYLLLASDGLFEGLTNA
jgi:serine/threonine protein phosphatase PrpC